jgi:hypothetical protein
MTFRPVKYIDGDKLPAVDPRTIEHFKDFVEKIGPLPELEVLEVDLQDDGLATLLERCPRLRSLALAETSYSGEEFPMMERLEEIYTYDTTISDEGLAAMLRCPALKSLQIVGGDKVTKAGLLRIPQLRRPALREVKIKWARLTQQEALEVVQAIQAACPDLQIEVEGQL